MANIAMIPDEVQSKYVELAKGNPENMNFLCAYWAFQGIDKPTPESMSDICTDILSACDVEMIKFLQLASAFKVEFDVQEIMKVAEIEKENPELWMFKGSTFQILTWLKKNESGVGLITFRYNVLRR
jgi:hypothetical protein